MAVGRHRPGPPLPSGAVARHGGVQVSEVQRSRMLNSAVQVVSEYGYGQLTVARVTGRARVSRRTFYDVFEDREDCFLAAFEDALARAASLLIAAYEGERDWREKVRAGLAALLVFLDEQPQMGSLLIVNALRAGPRVLERRAEVLAQLGVVLQQGGSRAKAGREFPVLTGEGVVGAVFSVIHTRLLQQDSGPLVELLNPLMGMIVLPYQGPAVAQREVDRRGAGTFSSGRKTPVGLKSSARLADPSLAGDPLAGLPMRITYRTLRVLRAVAELSDASNREVAERAGVSDQGQISKLLGRLERLGLIQNTAAAGEGHHRRQPTGEPNAWRLTSQGLEVQRAVQAQSPASPRVGRTGEQC
jgi:AcrR family transcriptional regulator